MRQRPIATIGLTALASAALVLAGCSGSDSVTSGAGKGRVRMIMGGPSTQAATTGAASATVMPDGSGRTIESASITLSSILARNLDGELVGVSMDLPMTIDLMGLIDGKTVELPIGSLPVGSYDQLVIVIRSLSVVLSDGTKVDVTPPGGGWTAIVPTEAFDVVDGSVTTVHLKFRSDRAFRWVNGQLDFTPGFDCDVDHHHDDGDDDDEDGDHDD